MTHTGPAGSHHRTDISAYAAALAEADRQARDELTQAVADADTEASSQLRKLRRCSRRAEIRPARITFRPSPCRGRTAARPRRPSTLSLLRRQAPAMPPDGTAQTRKPRRARYSWLPASTPRSSAGRARLSAVDALRGLLGDAKFQQYLTDRRTHALLGVATGIFGRLSGGEFGFAEDFQIVSIRSGAARSPKTLSGGETFLASLALALALVELHSRSGARLGALFLDEGFGSLDVDALASSLAVLQAETGGDKLVAVISHLHAVAEAVEDVMWVERQPEGSSARWLTQLSATPWSGRKSRADC